MHLPLVQINHLRSGQVSSNQRKAWDYLVLIDFSYCERSALEPKIYLCFRVWDKWGTVWLDERYLLNEQRNFRLWIRAWSSEIIWKDEKTFFGIKNKHILVLAENHIRGMWRMQKVEDIIWGITTVGQRTDQKPGRYNQINQIGLKKGRQ